MFLIPVLLLVFLYLHYNDRDRLHPSSKGNTALTKLKERYIGGEIDEETYLRMKTVIED